MIAICEIRYYMSMLNSGKSNNCHAKSQINLELVLVVWEKRTWNVNKHA